MVGVAGEMAMEDKFAAAALTLRVAVDCSVPELAVMVAVPDAEPTTIPGLLTLAMVESEELHCAVLVKSLVVPSDRCAVAVNCCWAPMPIDMEVGEICIEEMVGWTPGFGFGPAPVLQPVRKANNKRSPVQSAAFINHLPTRF